MALVREFVDAVRGGRPLVKQMLMGGGKTTVVGPMLALMLGDGRTLAAWWDGGREIRVHIDAGGGVCCVQRWDVWNEVWD